MPEFTFLNGEEFSAAYRDLQNTLGKATDFAVLLGCSCEQMKHENIARYIPTSDIVDSSINIFYFNDENRFFHWFNEGGRSSRLNGALPRLSFGNLPSNTFKCYSPSEIEFGEYPQFVADDEISKILTSLYKNRSLKKTGKIYTTDSRKYDSVECFRERKHVEYVYKGEKYIRFIGDHNSLGEFLSDGTTVHIGDVFWIKVDPIKWFVVDGRNSIAVSKNVLFSGIKINENSLSDLTFEQTDIYKYLNTYFAKDIIPSGEILLDTQPVEEQIEEFTNPYGLSFEQISEEETIKGAVLSDIPVFLHGRSSEGKSARVKQIDPDCVILYLRNATPDSLNGKSVYNHATGEMIDIKPTWLVKLETLCEKEPDKIHILFLDELTNALPSIQGMAFNIVLDREVNGLWKLPSNARIVAAGNELNDSLAANELAEPLFNRFAHVYIETTLDNWLNWATKNNIHPLIFAYIAYRRDQALRTKYDGIKPNADPRKWEMASKMLYETKNPYMLKSLIGEELTKEFAEFCSYNFITLEDVLNDNYNEDRLDKLNISEKHATVSLMMQVDEKNFRKVRDFVAKLGNEYLAMFEGRWANTDERLEIIQEIRLEKQEKQLKL